jgi:hypothetical protein
VSGQIEHEVVQVGGEWHIIVFYDGDVVNEAVVDPVPDRQDREVKQLLDQYASFTGTYDDACDIFETWVSQWDGT